MQSPRQLRRLRWCFERNTKEKRLRLPFEIVKLFLLSLPKDFEWNHLRRRVGSARQRKMGLIGNANLHRGIMLYYYQKSLSGTISSAEVSAALLLGWPSVWM